MSRSVCRKKNSSGERCHRARATDLQTGDSHPGNMNLRSPEVLGNKTCPGRLPASHRSVTTLTLVLMACTASAGSGGPGGPGRASTEPGRIALPAEPNAPPSTPPPGDKSPPPVDVGPPLAPGAPARTADDNHAPTLEILEPLEGDVVEGMKLRVRWRSSDPDDDKLTYFAALSTDGGGKYQAIAMGLRQAELQHSLEHVSGTDHAMIQVHAADGLVTTTATAGPFTIPKRGPQVLIDSPVPGTTFVAREMIVFEADIRDNEDGHGREWSRQDVVWRSNLDGDVCRGRVCSVVVNRWLKCVDKRCSYKRLKRGTHTVTVSATDSDDMTTEATVRIEVQ